MNKNALNVPQTNKTNPIISHDIADKLMLLDRIEKTMHQKLDEKMLPEEKAFTYFDSISPMKGRKNNDKKNNHINNNKNQDNHNSFGGKFIRYKVGES